MRKLWLGDLFTKLSLVLGTGLLIGPRRTAVLAASSIWGLLSLGSSCTEKREFTVAGVGALCWPCPASARAVFPSGVDPQNRPCESGCSWGLTWSVKTGVEVNRTDRPS